MATYLRSRAAGISRLVASRALPRPLTNTTLVGIEWNALTYAGHTVWNVHNEYRAPRLGQDLQRVAGGYTGGSKRRARAEWVIQENTHPALITTEEAERIIAALEASPFKPTRRSKASALLTGILRTPGGDLWTADRIYYRCAKKGQGRLLRRAQVDQAVIRRVMEDLASERFVAAAYEATMRQYAQGHGAELAELRAQVRSLEQRASRFMDMAAELESPAPVLKKVNEVERERAGVAARIAELEAADQRAAALREITPAHILELLRTMADAIEAYDPDRLKDFLASQLERVELDPAGTHLDLCYRIQVPAVAAGGFEWRPHGKATLIHRSRAVLEAA